MAMAAAVVLALADLDEAVDVWDAMRAHAYRNGSAFTIGSVQLWGGYTQYLRGDLREAESELRASLETVAFWGMPTRAQWQSPILAEILVERGELGEARALLDAVISPPPSSDHAILVDRASMRVLLADGRPEEALAYADVYELHAGWKRHPRYVPWRSLKAQALERLGPHDEAVALAGEELEIARGWGSPGTVGRSLRVLGAILRTDGIEQLEEACARSRRCRRGSSRRRRLPGSGPRCDRRASRPRPASRCGARWSWRTRRATACGRVRPRSTRQAPARARPPSEECLP